MCTIYNESEDEMLSMTNELITFLVASIIQI